MLTSSSGVKSLDNIVAILDCFTFEKPEWSLAEISRHLGVPKPSVHRYLVAMEHFGMLHRVNDGAWRLGHRLFVWGQTVTHISNLRDIARPHMRSLVEATHETALLTIYDNQQIICIDKIESERPVRMNALVGSCHPIHAGASSKILTASLPAQEIDALIRYQGLPQLSTNTITDEASLLQELQAIRSQGYAISHEETDQEAWGVAVPVRDRSGVVIAGIGIAGPVSRYSRELEEEYIALCLHASRMISAALNGSG